MKKRADELLSSLPSSVEVPLPQSIQQSIEDFARQFLGKGRFGWDEPHTRAVVYYALVLGSASEQDLATLFTAAWFHDIGYYGLFVDGRDAANWNKITDRKARHMAVGATLSQEFLAQPEIQLHYTPTQLARIPHLISVHDNIEALTALDELVLMEADTLGAIDVSRVTPTFDQAGYQKYRASGLPRRERQFATPLGKELYRQLLPAFTAHFQLR